MTDLQFFAFVVLPLVVVAVGGTMLLVELRRRRVHPVNEPDLFDAPRPRNVASREGLARRSKRG